MAVLAYIWQAIESTFRQLLHTLMPFAALGMFTQFCTNMLRNSLSAMACPLLFIYLTAPGTVIHELSHGFFCILFGHKIVDLKLFTPNSVGTLGYVNHSYNRLNPYHRIGNFFIGIGPIICITAIIYLLTMLLVPEILKNEPASCENAGLLELLKFNAKAAIQYFRHFFNFAIWQKWGTWAWLMLVLMLASHITLSLPDLKGVLDGFLAIILVLFFTNLSIQWKWNGSDEIVIWLWKYLSPAFIILLFTNLIFAAITIFVVFFRKVF